MTKADSGGRRLVLVPPKGRGDPPHDPPFYYGQYQKRMLAEAVD
jgi:hypothetical protein